MLALSSLLAMRRIRKTVRKEMARHKLTETKVKAALKAGKPDKLGDGDGLWLYVQASGTASWVFIWVRHKWRRELGLGSAAFAMCRSQTRGTRPKRYAAFSGAAVIRSRNCQNASPLGNQRPSARSATISLQRRKPPSATKSIRRNGG
ncbi:Arm DNA-binding domain-containing protein [Rhizobium leguminosarum]|uniref:Arm DNA-binding domain-containing protein n=1 Tax=Rhizobium leguminosarum TaxID=384 RepID=UPI0038739A1A